MTGGGLLSLYVPGYPDQPKALYHHSSIRTYWPFQGGVNINTLGPPPRPPPLLLKSSFTQEF